MAAQRLVIVDDEPVILRLLTSMFADEPYEVVACKDGVEGREAIERGVDVLLTDKNLPGVGGLELLREAKLRDPLCEVLMITGYASIETVVQAFQLQAFDYIVKPPSDIFHVKRKVAQAFEKVRLSRENADLVQRLQARNAELEGALAEVEAVQSELIQSEKLAGIGTLAAGIAHEISSPLFGIMGLAEAIVDEEDPALARSYARDIVEYSRSIKKIVGQLTDYSRTSGRDLDARADVAEVALGAIQLISRSTAGERTVPVDCPPGAAVRADPNELQQVFVNLIKNAHEALDERYGPGGGQVQIRVQVDGDTTVIRIEDDGPGIPEDRLRSIFDPFYTTKPPGRGTGLGLNIVYRLVTRCGGAVHVESEVGAGTTFVLQFPSA